MPTTEELIKMFPLGRIKSKPDFNDYKLGNFIPRGTMTIGNIGSKCWDFPSSPLYQGETGHCGGFSMADWGICSPTNTMYTNDNGHDFYYKCKIVDGEPGNEDGSCIRSAAKVLKSLKKIEAYAFASSVDEIKWWLLNKGPVIAGTLWTNDMFIPDFNNRIRPTGEPVGGHAYLLTEWTEDNYIGIQNSWDGYWGVNGKAYISATDFTSLFVYDGEAMTAVELENAGAAKTNSWINFIQMLIRIIAGR
jgi:hypothetical protein